MSSHYGSHRTEGELRPAFMTTLGLLPPYTLEDVKQAYLVKVKRAHPDSGGSISEFRHLQEAYEQAQNYVGLQVDRRAWIANQMDRYLARQDVEQRLRDFGAKLDVPHTDWLEGSLGDFAELTAAIEGLDVRDLPHGNAVVDYLVEQKGSLNRLKRLNLIGCGLTIDRALKLTNFPLLSHLDVSHNRLSARILEVVSALPLLESVRVDQSRVGWWTRMRLQRLLRQRQAEVPAVR